jgi:hypothetical protein
MSEVSLLGSRRGELVISNVVFVILNIVFFALLLIFVVTQGSNVHKLEQVTSKQVALVLDALRPGTTVTIDIADVLRKAEPGLDPGGLILIDRERNVVVVKLTSEGVGYSHRFFNDIQVASSVDVSASSLEVKA